MSSDHEVLILDSASDSELLAAHVAGHPDAFTEIVRRHRDRLWAVALKTTSDPEDAADALQDALISAYRRASQFRGDSQVTTWLHRIVVNASLDRMRRRSTRPTVPLPVEEETGIALPAGANSSSISQPPWLNYPRISARPWPLSILKAGRSTRLP